MTGEYKDFPVRNDAASGWVEFEADFANGVTSEIVTLKVELELGE